MWSRASSESAQASAGGRCAQPAGCGSVRARAGAWLGLALLTSALIALSACSSTPPRPQPAAAPAHTAAASAKTAAGDATASAPAAPAVHPDVPPAARADFDRAVQYMRSGNAIEAELGFKQVALQYPQFSAPLVNLAILQRKEGHLDQAETTLKDAVAREQGSAVAWTELGATQRMRGEFRDAASSYEQAITADPRYAPAWRNLGVVSDLYLGDPNRALKAFEQYKELTGEDKPVSGWIAELRQRLGMTPAKRPAAAPAGEGATPAAPGGGGSAPAAPGDAQPSNKGAPPAGKPPQAQPPPGKSPVNAAAGTAASRTGG